MPNIGAGDWSSEIPSAPLLVFECIAIKVCVKFIEIEESNTCARIFQVCGAVEFDHQRELRGIGSPI